MLRDNGTVVVLTSYIQLKKGVAELMDTPNRSEEGSKVADVQERVIEIIAEQMGIGKEQVTPEKSITNDLGADSLDAVELVMELEEEFDITIPDEDAEKIKTVGEAVSYVKEHI